MQGNPYESYLETQVLGASPVELVGILYRAAIDAIGSARRYLADGEIASRAQAVARATNVIGELVQSLNPAQGGKLAEDLRELYDYILRRIQAGNFEQEDAPLAEAERLLTTLLEAWQTVAADQRGAAPDLCGSDAGVPSASLSVSF